MFSPLYYVTKRNGEEQALDLNRITKRVMLAIQDSEPKLNLTIHDVFELIGCIVSGLKPSVTTAELDEIAIATCINKPSIYTDHHQLGTLLFISNVQKHVEHTHQALLQLVNDTDMTPMCAIYHSIGVELHDRFKERLSRPEWVQTQMVIDESRDKRFDYVAISMMRQTYLWRTRKLLEKQDGHCIPHIVVNGESSHLIETPQWLYYRCALLCATTPEDVKPIYDALSLHRLSLSTASLLNLGLKSGNPNPCFLACISDDSIDGIGERCLDAMQISKRCGGYGLHFSKVRCKGSPIRSAPGASSAGIVPFVQIFNAIGKAVNQGNKRKGSIAIYLDVWHYDLLDFLDLRKVTGKAEHRARDLFYGLMLPDLFFKRCKDDQNWSLFDPNVIPIDLNELSGCAFEHAYTTLENDLSVPRKTLPGRDVLWAIFNAVLETGMPYLIFSDAANSKSNQQHLGKIHSSNLCTEILEHTSATQTAVCTLATVCLPAFLNQEEFDFVEMMNVTRLAVDVLNEIIDLSVYPIPSAQESNKKNRPLGIGIQGLADVLMQLDLNWEDEAAQLLNVKIAAALHYAALDASCALAKEHGPHESYVGSPAEMGLLQFDLWHITPIADPMFDWLALRQRIAHFGLYNSLLTAYPPTASTSALCGNSECFEPLMENIFVRNLLSGHYRVINRHLVADLKKHDLWTPEIVDQIVAGAGSIQAIDELPQWMKQKYRTIYELSQKLMIDYVAARAPYVDQSQPLNLYFRSPSFDQVVSAWFYAWEKGLKTGMYYLRQKKPVETLPFWNDKKFYKPSCSLENTSCEACSG